MITQLRAPIKWVLAFLFIACIAIALYCYFNPREPSPISTIECMASKPKVLSNILFEKMPITKCREGDDGIIYAEAQFDADGINLPVSVQFDKRLKKIERAFTNIVGGPGSKVLDIQQHRLTADPLSAWRYEKYLKCNAIILTPAYSGTNDKSNYPAESITTAISELQQFGDYVDTIYNTEKNVTFAGSLGAYLHNATGRMDKGHTFLIVPLVRSPEDAMKFVINNPDSYEYRYKASWKQQYHIGYERKKEWVPQDEFIRNFYGSSSYLTKSFFDIFDQKYDTQQKLPITIVMGDGDFVPGDGKTFSGKLKQRGLNTYSLPLITHYIGDHNWDMIQPILDKKISKICN